VGLPVTGLAGAALVGRIGALAAAADHHPDIDLRPEEVTVRLFSGVWEQLSKRDASWPGRSLPLRASWAPRRIRAACSMSR
jgi:hypothetical protein